MHSIVVPSLPAFLTSFSFTASQTPCCPFLPLTPLQSPPVEYLSYKSADISFLPFPIGDKPLYRVKCTAGTFVEDKNSNQWYYRSSRGTVARNVPDLFYNGRDHVF